jgi:hypothetical protein
MVSLLFFLSCSKGGFEANKCAKKDEAEGLFELSSTVKYYHEQKNRRTDDK